jgi:spermidine synthase
MTSVTNSNNHLDVGVKWIMLIYFCSGLCSLIDEVVWVRLLKLTLGNTVYASSIVVSMFLGGLALGAFIMSRYADKTIRPLRIYAVLEVLASISALSLPWLLGLADGAYRWYFAKFDPSPKGLLSVQVIVSAAILLLPAMVMGSTLPLLGRYVTTLRQKIGRLVGRLYALNTFGAAIGCFLAGFILIKTVGVMGTLYIAAAINLFVALGGWILSRSHDATTAAAAEIPLAPTEPEAATIAQPADHKQYVVMLGFFLSGLISIGYELIWMRSVTFMLGGFTYVFSAVLTIYLLGNVIGAWIGSRLSKRLKNPSAGFGVSLSCLGLLGVLYIPWAVVWWGHAVYYIDPLVTGLMKNIPVANRTFWPMFHSTFLFLLPALTMGIGFPLALQAWSNYRHKVGQTTGIVYSVNTIGAVLGGIITGFLLIPLFGVQISITILGLAGVWLGLTMVQLFSVNIAVKSRISFALIAVGLTVIGLKIPENLFQHRFLRVGNAKLLAVKEGVTTTVSVCQDFRGQRTLSTSGIRVAGDIKGVFRVPQKILGHLGILLNKNTKTVLSVGFGSGETTACMSLHNLDRIECVELSPELTEIALKFFRHINLGDKLDEKVKMLYMDAKNYLHLTQNRYDLIVNDCINPSFFADNASLYTKEYFQDALDHLNPGGIFGTYFPIVEIPISSTNSILGTISEVFPYVTIWFPITAPSNYDFWYLAATKEPQLFSPKYIDEQLQNEAVQDSAALINLLNSQYVLSCYIGDQDDLKRYLKEYKLNSDYRPFVEFTSDESESWKAKKEWLAQFLAKVRRGNILEHIDWTGMSKDQQESWAKEHELFYNASACLLKSRVEQDLVLQLQNSYEVLSLVPDHPALLEQQEISLTALAWLLRRKLSADVVLTQMDRTLAKQPNFGAAWVAKSLAFQQKNQMYEALDAAKKALQYSPNLYYAQNNIGELFLKLNQPDKAVEHYKKAIHLMPEKAMLYFNLGTAFSQQNKFDEAISQLRKCVELHPLSVRWHYSLAELLAKSGQIDQAINEYRAVLAINPNFTPAKEKLSAMLATTNK